MRCFPASCGLVCLIVCIFLKSHCYHCYVLQVKFSELTLDMFRLLQTLEREPQDELGGPVVFSDSSPAPGRIPLENGGLVGRRENPHKAPTTNICAAVSVGLGLKF